MGILAAVWGFALAVHGANEGLELRPLSALGTPSGPTLFRRMPPESTRIQLVHTFPATGSFELLQDHGGGGGICVGDFDGDGLPDLFFTRYDQGNFLYRNLGGWVFEEIGAKAGIRATGWWCLGASAVDVDNDGDLDVFVAVHNAPNLLFVNRGDGTFEEQAAGFGLAFSGASVSMAFDDYDRDGRIDGHLVTHRLAVGPDSKLPRSSKEGFTRGILQIEDGKRPVVAPAYRELFEIMSKGGGRSELMIAGQKDRLFHGLSQKGFEDRTDTAGIQGNEIGLASHWWDFDGDGWPDLYVSNDYKGSDRLFHNERDGTFRDVTATALPFVPWSSMGSDSADIDNDGFIDFIATDMSGSTHQRRMQMHQDDKEFWFLRVAHPKQYPRNAVFVGTGSGRALEVGHMTGLANTDWTWSPKFGDFDNDGWVDLFIADGMARDFVNSDLLKTMRDRGNQNWLKTPMLQEPNHAYRNLGDLRFEDVSARWGVDARSASYGAVVADLDRDGDLDLVVMSLGESPLVYRNESTEGSSCLVRLRGQQSNAFGIGATVRIRTDFGFLVRRMTLSSGFISANEPLLHFGLGGSKEVKELQVEWPSGQTQSFVHLPVHQLLTITESAQKSEKPSPIENHRNVPNALFEASPVISAAIHQEQEFDDFGREPLMPWGLSRLGPGMACGDVNGDGLEDLYLGGAAGFPGSIWIQTKDHQFQKLEAPAYQIDTPSEDMGSLFLDVDGDGDLDLFVVSGGVECADGDDVLADRLYLNDGRGGFQKATSTQLPRETDSGSFVVAADWDRDGDLDLFVGGRCLPGRYPMGGRNHLLRNEGGGRFVDVTESVAPQLQQTGMVAGGLWSDVDGDGWMDLILLHEWGPIRWFRNQSGNFQEVLAESDGQAASLLRTGWWTGIAAADVNGDGLMDYVVGNLGENTPYQADASHPVVGYYGEWEGAGGAMWVEGYYEGNRLVPRRRWEVLRETLPTVLGRFPTAAVYGAASLEDLFGAAALNKAQRFTMNTLSSGVWMNQGNFRLRFQAFPRRAQVAPAFGVLATDLDGDGAPDVLLNQNFSGTRIEMGAFNSGMGMLLKGDGAGGWAPVGPERSGWTVAGDGRAAICLDWNGDHRPDVIIGQNDGPCLAFQNRSPMGNRFLEVRLVGLPGNPTGVGARVTLKAQGLARPQTSEVYAGSGYLSQSSPRLFFGLGAEGRPQTLEVRWPRGSLSRVNLDPNSSLWVVDEKDASAPSR